MNVIEFKNVDLAFQTKVQRIEIFRDLNLEIRRGDFVTIKGPSGMGKSTLLNLISGFVKPNKGEILVNGNDIMKMSDAEVCEYRNKRIGYIFQTFNLIMQFNVRDNVAVPLLLNTKDKEYIDNRVSELLEFVKMTNREYEYPQTLSGGEQQRVAFARAIANSPDIILADEPTGNLDSLNRDNLINMLRDLHENEGKTIIAVSHDEKLIEIAQTIINIEDIISKDRNLN